MDDFDDFAGFMANEDIHDELEREQNESQKRENESLSFPDFYTEIYSVPTINDVKNPSDWLDNDDDDDSWRDREGEDYSFDDDEKEEVRG